MKKSIYTFFFVLLYVSAFAQPQGWSHKRVIQVTENSGTTVTNYQLKLYIDTQTEINAGRMLASGDDIRFSTDCEATTLLNHWIEGPMNDDSTVIWVKIPSLPANGTTSIFMQYGNPLATSTSAIVGCFIGPHSSTDSVASGNAGGAQLSQRGFRFAPTQDILVQSFGKREPTGTTRYVTLFNFTTQAILRQMQVSGPAAQYSYGALTSPIWLTTGTQYVLELYQGTGDGYYFGTSSAIGQHLTYLDMRYCNSCTQNTFPTNTLSNYHYGYPDLWYFTKNNVSPAPTAVIGAVLPSLAAQLVDLFACKGDSLTLNSAITGNLGATTCLWTPSTGLNNPSDCNPMMVLDSTVAFSLTVSDSAGCASNDSIWIFNNSPTIAVSYDSTVICAGDTVDFEASGTDFYTWGPGGSLSATSGDSVLAFPSATTLYTAIGTDSLSGCTDTVSFTLNVSTVMAVVVLGPLNMCEGDTLTLTVSGGDAYTWSPGTSLSDTLGSTVLATPASDITYFVTAWDTVNNCSATNSIDVLVHANPVVTFELLDHFCDIDPAVQLTGGSPAGGTYSGPSVNAGMFAPGTAGVGSHVLTYTYADLNGCEGSDTATAIVDVCIGVTPGVEVSFTVHPNPSNGVFTITMGDNPEETSFRVVNLMGQVIRTGKVESGKTLLDLETQPAGLYILTVESLGLRKTFNLEILR